MTKTTPARHTIAVVACTGVVLSLAACGRSESTDEPKAPSDAIADGPASGTIDVWAMGTEGEELGPFVAEFEKANPDADVNVTAVPWEAAHDKIKNAITAGSTPDVSLIGTTWMGEFAAAGGFDPTPEGLVDEASFYEGAWDSTVVNDTSYGVPWYVETRVLFYRKDLAAAAGWDEAPASWEELTQFATDLKDQGGSCETPLYVQPGQTGSWQTVLPFAWTAGAQTVNADGTEYVLDDEGMQQGLEYYQSLFDEELSMTSALDPGALESGFVKGDICSFISGPWEIGLTKDAGATDDQLGLAPLPGQTDGMGTSFIGGGDLAVFADADNREGGWKLVQWLSEAQTQADWYTTMSDLPAVKSAWDTGELAEDPQLGVFGEQLEQGKAPPAVPTWEEVAAVIDSNAEKVARGTISAEDAVADMQSQASSIGTGL